MLADLHLHSTASDGVLSPRALHDYVRSKGVTLMAVTDHDAMDGVHDLLNHPQPDDLSLIPGVELSMSNAHAMHLLGYGLRISPKLQSALDDLKAKRFHRIEEMMARLRQMGIQVELPLDQLNAPGRPHIGRELVRMGVVSDLKEAFNKYLGHGCPAYVPGKKLSMEEAIPLLRESGYVPVLAHPALLHHAPHELEPLLRQWVDVGLMGIEVYHPANNPEWQALMLRMAQRYDLLVTGGSDFHQSGDSHGEPGCMAAAWVSMGSDVAKLQESLAVCWQQAHPSQPIS